MSQITLVALFGVAVACSGGKSGAPAGASAPAPTAQTQRRDPDVITRAEIEQATWATDAFVLVQRLRPSFLRVSGPTNVSGVPQTPLVRLNEQELGDHGALRQIQLSSVQEIRYYSASDATAKFGGSFPSASAAWQHPWDRALRPVEFATSSASFRRHS